MAIWSLLLKEHLIIRSVFNLIWAIWEHYYLTVQGYGNYHNKSYMSQPIQGVWNDMTQPRIPFLVTLNFPDLLKLTNNLVSHDLMCMIVPAKLPLDIPKFEGKSGEDPGEHVMTFHLWCSSNSLNTILSV